MNTPVDLSKETVTFADVQAAAKQIAGVAHRTPVMTSHTVNEHTGATVFFKCENLQRVGAFKFRGAFNALSRLSEEEKQRGVVAFSSGNHAQAVALAGQLLDIPRAIVMPENAPEVKRAATRDYGAEIITYDPAETVREELAASIANDRGMTLIPSFDHPHIVAGQGTTALELFEDVGELDVLLVGCGGGGLLSGCGIAAGALAPECRVIGVEPEAADDATRSFQTRELQTVQNPDTIADGARTPSLGTITFPLVLEHVDEMVTVSDEALLQAMFFLWERMKLVVEPTGALATATLLSGIPVKGKGRRVGVVITGGNVDLRQAARWFATL